MQVRGGLTDIVVKGVGNVSAGSEKVIELGSNTAAKGVTQVTEFAAGIENRVAANGIEAVVRLSMPVPKSPARCPRRSPKVPASCRALRRASR